MVDINNDDIYHLSDPATYDTDTWGHLVLLTTSLNHKTCINTSRQVLEKTLFTINAIFTQDNNLSKTKVEPKRGPCRKQTLHVQNVKQA